MRLLLDTHTFLWFIAGDEQLSRTARGLIEDPANERWFSIASVWEIAIKVSVGKLSVAGPVGTVLEEQMRRNDVHLLNVSVTHAHRTIRLPFHHRDPFDRMLAAQSLVEALSLVSSDQVFDAYGVQRAW